MKKNLLVSLILISLLVVPNFAQKAKPKPKLPQVVKNKPVVGKTESAVKQQTSDSPFVNKTLPNGLEVIVLSDSSVPVVTIELAVRNGSFTEPPEYNGLSHLYEHMFFK
ncbi:MAG: insulinase family protein, partial [Pyrinomonadaceae bacterium]|nr:insulinase family protein [Pyrinomonadaceae bacterium]